MTEGESGEHKSQNSCIDQDLLALGCGLDLDIDRYGFDINFMIEIFANWIFYSGCTWNFHTNFQDSTRFVKMNRVLRNLGLG